MNADELVQKMQEVADLCYEDPSGSRIRRGKSPDDMLLMKRFAHWWWDARLTSQQRADFSATNQHTWVGQDMINTHTPEQLLVLFVEWSLLGEP